MSNIGPPLAGIRILAISQFGAGPFGTALLADLGAEVIKIEDPGAGGDVSRYVPPTDLEEDSLYFQAFNRGKKSIALNLRSPGGMAVFHDLVRVADGVFNNLRGDLPAKLGVDYGALHSVNPSVVCCSLSGFGANGPMASEPGYDYLVQGYAGYMSITGEPDGPPGKSGVSVIDFAGGYAAMVGLLAGLLDSKNTGRGRDIDVSLLDTAVSMLSYFAAWSLNTEWEPARTANSAHQTLVPSQNFQTSDAWIIVFCAKEKFYRDLVEAMGLPELATDPRFDSFSVRHENRDILIPLLAKRFQDQTTGEWLELLRGKVPCGPVNTLAEALSNDQVRARGMIVEVEHPVLGPIREVGSPIKTPGLERKPNAGPGLGEHTDALLGDLLGYDETRINELRESGAVA